jgi:histidinol-phosphate aminotransferase
MSGNFLALAQPGVQQLSPYVPGKPVDELARELNLDPAKIVKLASNENPLGPSPKVLAAIREELAELTRYPDGNGFALKSLLAEKCRVELNQVTLGNGSNDILELVGRAYLAPGLNAVFSEHAFAVYPIVTQAVGADARVIPAKDWGHDLPAMLAAIDAQTRVVFIANPNNPTGTWFDAQALNDFLQDVPEHVLVVLDEAYIEYAEGSDLPEPAGIAHVLQGLWLGVVAGWLRFVHGRCCGCAEPRAPAVQRQQSRPGGSLCGGEGCRVPGRGSPHQRKRHAATAGRFP